MSKITGNSYLVKKVFENQEALNQIININDNLGNF